MKAYLISLAVGVLVGVIYSALHVRSPAPPAIALVGLLGMLLGEQLLPQGQKWWQGSATPAAETLPADVPTPPSTAPIPQPATSATGHAPPTAGTPPPPPGPDG